MLGRKQQGNTIVMFGMAIFVVAMLVLIVIGFLSGPTNPIPWVLLVILGAVLFMYDKLAKGRYLQWKDSYSVGIEAMDNDHKRLIHLINNLQTAIQYKTDSEFERQTLNEVIDYTKTHFAREEALMQEHGYADFDAHKAKHQQMIDLVNGFVATYEKDPSTTLESLLDYLKNWLIKHINGTDQEYSQFLKDKGVS